MVKAGIFSRYVIALRALPLPSGIVFIKVIMILCHFLGVFMWSSFDLSVFGILSYYNAPVHTLEEPRGSPLEACGKIRYSNVNMPILAAYQI